MTICPKCNAQISEEDWQVDNPKLSWFDLRCPMCENLVNIIELNITNTKDLKKVKRDLKADLELCNKATPGPWVKDERVGCVAVYPRSIGEINCMGESEGKRIFYKGGYKVLDKDGRFKHWEVHPQDIEDAEFVAQAREGWPHAIERAIKAEALTRELVGVIDELRRQINECGLDDEMWEVYERAKNWINTPHHK